MYFAWKGALDFEWKERFHVFYLKNSLDLPEKERWILLEKELWILHEKERWHGCYVKNERLVSLEKERQILLEQDFAIKCRNFSKIKELIKSYNH